MQEVKGGSQNPGGNSEGNEESFEGNHIEEKDDNFCFIPVGSVSYG